MQHKPSKPFCDKTDPAFYDSMCEHTRRCNTPVDPVVATRKSVLACDDLLADGWREYPDQFKRYARCFYKQFDTLTRCHRNDDKPGMQIEIAVSDGYAGGVSMEIELCAGLKDETWLKIQNYSLPKTEKEVTVLIPRLLAMWEAANNKTP